jgi:uncharacterized SAM-dependent methyltransferase
LLFNRFILNGLKYANELLNENVFDIKDWKVIGEYVFDIDGGRHQAFYAPNKDVIIRGISVREGERVQVEQSLKYSAKEAEKLWEASGLKEVGKWTASKHEYSTYCRFIILLMSQFQSCKVLSKSLKFLTQEYSCESGRHDFSAWAKAIA